ncbi:MAG: hypothetical protein ACOCSC_01480 [Candidatus Hadarchaeota archaeon]
MLLEEIEIPKDKGKWKRRGDGRGDLEYFFIGGMNYSRKFGFQKSHNRYPFTTYYMDRIEDVVHEGITYRSLFYCKLPLICLQFEDGCECIEFELPAICGGKSVYPFVGLVETQSSYRIIFKHFPEFTLKQKDTAWLGRGKKREVREDCHKIEFKIRRYRTKDWVEAVRGFMDSTDLQKEGYNPDTDITPRVNELCWRSKEALKRSYDSEVGTFLQLPWRESSGFVFSLYSYSLLSYEAVRLSYFSQLYRKTGDPDFKSWMEGLRELFVNPELYRDTDDGLFWHNMTHFDGKKLKGYSYMDVGFAGYPGGQGLISRSLLEYLETEDDTDIEELVKKNLEFILNAQNIDGSWNAAIPFKRFNPSSMMTRWSKSEGATAENVRALLKAYKRFEDDRYVSAALRGLEYLQQENPICRNVLRDIGLEEPEGYSAILAVNAFLDALQVFGDNKFLEYASIYAHHLLTFHYWYGSIYGHFHPITESINPRLSPFESLMVVKTYRRMGEVTGDKLWDTMSSMLLNRTLELVDQNGGLSEGVFVRYGGELQTLVMEQTFATAELVHTVSDYNCYHYRPIEKKELKVEDMGDKIVVEDFLEVNKRHFEFLDKKNNYSLDIEMSKPYKLSSRLKTLFLNRLRGLGLVAGVVDLKYLIKGVHPPEEKVDVQSLKEYVTGYKVAQRDRGVVIEAELSYHRILIELFKTRFDEVFMDLSIDVKGHDLKCDKVVISFDRTYDETLKTNWTHGGVYRRVFPLSG